MASDGEVGRLFASDLAHKKQDRLDALAEAKKARRHVTAEEAELVELTEEAQTLLLRKAEALRLLAYQGLRARARRMDPRLPT